MDCIHTNFVSLSISLPPRPLHLAVQLTQYPDIVEVLLEGGADPNASNSTESTPLIITCQTNNVFSASALLKRGIIVYIYIHDGEQNLQTLISVNACVTKIEMQCYCVHTCTCIHMCMYCNLRNFRVKNFQKKISC